MRGNDFKRELERILRSKLDRKMGTMKSEEGFGQPIVITLGGIRSTGKMDPQFMIQRMSEFDFELIAQWLQFHPFIVNNGLVIRFVRHGENQEAAFRIEKEQQSAA